MYSDAVCGGVEGKGEYLCDAEHVLTTQGRKSVVASIQMFRERTLVPCDSPAALESNTQPDFQRKEVVHANGTKTVHHYVPFIVAVFIVKGFAPEVRDANSLGLFGLQLLGQWQLFDRAASGYKCD